MKRVGQFHASAGRRAIQMCLIGKAGVSPTIHSERLDFEILDVIDAENNCFLHSGRCEIKGSAGDLHIAVGMIFFGADVPLRLRD
jgi:hypothetical protein